MLRKSVLVLSLTAALLPVNVSGLGMGTIQLETALNQPLLAEIDLLSADPETLSDLRVRLADEAAFQRVGMDRPFLLTKLRFQATVTDRGKPVIRVTSQEPIREPFLNFLLELNWPTGRQVREYALLLDPPVTAESVRPAVESPQVPVLSVKPRESREPVGGASTYGPTKASDTAWVIADKVRPDKSVSVQQMMMALLAANPDAFDDGNVNKLKRGITLQIPDMGLISAMTAREAAQAFREQTAEWRSARSGKAEVSPRPATRERPASVGASADTAKPELDLVGGESETPQGAGSVGESDEVQRLRRDLALVSEQADAARQDNEKLRDSIADLAEQVREMQRLLVLRDQEMARLQNRLRESNVSDTVPKRVDEAESPGTPVAAVEAGPAVVAATPKPETVPPAREKVPETKPRPEPVVSKDTLTEPETAAPWYAFLTEQPMILAGGAGVLLLGGLLLLLRKKREEKEAQEMAAELAPAAGVPLSKPSERRFDDREVDPQNEPDQDFADLDGGDAFGDELSGEVDTLAEADVYMAYGRYNQAEELVRQALDKDPDNSDLKLKLLEIYYGLRDKDRFAEYLEEEHTSLSSAGALVWRRVQNMGRELVPNHALFAAGAGAATEMEEIEDLEDIADLPTFDDDLTDLEKGLDFDLGEPSSTKEEVPTDDDSAEQLLEEVYGAALGEKEALAKDDDEGRLLDFDMDFESVKKADEGDEDNLLDFDVSPKKAAAPNLDDEETLELRPVSSPTLDFGDLADELEVKAANQEQGEEIAIAGLGDLSEDDGDLNADQLEEVNTKLDLARAYRDLGDAQGALGMLEEVLTEGNRIQKEQAEALRREIAS